MSSTKQIPVSYFWVGVAALAAILFATLVTYAVAGLYLRRIGTATVTANDNQPVTLSQTHQDGSPLDWGGTAESAEVKLTAIALRSNDVKSAYFFVAGGQSEAEKVKMVPLKDAIAEVTFDELEPGPYRWRVKLASPQGAGIIAAHPPRASTEAYDFLIPQPPLEVASVDQYQPSGERLAVGGEAEEAVTVTAECNRSDVTLSVERKRCDVPFNATGLRISSTGETGTRSLYLDAASPGEYKWRWRIDAANGESSTWQSFGDNDEQADFVIPEKPAPDDAAKDEMSVSQYRQLGLGLGLGEKIFGGPLIIAENAQAMSRLHVEVKPCGVPFDESEQQSNAVKAGASTITLALSPGEYKWRWQMQTAEGATMPWRPHGENGDEADFVVIDAVDHTARRIDQYDEVEIALPLGGEVDQGPRMIAYDIPNDVARLEVEAKPLDQPFDGSQLDSNGVEQEGKARVALSLSPGAYKWRWRLQFREGDTTAWTSFGDNGNAPDFVVRAPPDQSADPPTDPPADQSEMFQIDQFHPLGRGLDLGAEVSVGPLVVAQSTSRDLELMIEAKPCAQPFDAQDLFSNSTDPDGLVGVLLSLPPGDYKWRWRLRDVKGQHTPWQAFGGNSEEPDFRRIDPPDGPPPRPSDVQPLAINQYDPAGVPLPIGERVPGGPHIKGTLVDDASTLSVEVKPCQLPFDAKDLSNIALGAAGKVNLRLTRQPGEYKWRWRTATAAGEFTEWQSFGDNGDEADFISIVRTAPPTDQETVTVFQFDRAGKLLSLGGRVASGPMITGCTSKSARRLVIEAVLREEAFSGESVYTQAVDSDGIAALALNLDPGQYKWRWQLQTDSDLATKWIPFGGNEDEADFIVIPEPIIIDQLDEVGEPLPLGTEVPAGPYIVAERARGATRLDVQVAAADEPFDETRIFSNGVDRNGRSQFGLVLHEGAYRWRWRLATGDGVTTSWEPFGQNADEADFVVVASPAPADGQTGLGGGGFAGFSSSAGKAGPNPSIRKPVTPLWELLTSRSMFLFALALIALTTLGLTTRITYTWVGGKRRA